jgi:hypothetical protein
MLAISLHQPVDGGTDGPVIAALAPPGTLAHAGEVTLPPSARPSLHQGRLYVSLLIKSHPRGALRGNLIPPPGSGARPTPIPAAPVAPVNPATPKESR